MNKLSETGKRYVKRRIHAYNILKKAMRIVFNKKETYEELSSHLTEDELNTFEYLKKKAEIEELNK